jgi:hypothetical protein
MKKIVLSLTFIAATVSAQENDVGIDSVSLFKNGLAVVRMTGSISDTGRLEIPDVPDPVHGTFWVGSKKPVTSKVELRPADTPLAAVSQQELLHSLAGKKVTLHTHHDTMIGTLLGESPERRKKWDRDYAMENGQPSWRHWQGRNSSDPTSQPPMTFLKLEGGGVVAIEQNQIRRVEFSEPPKIQRERPTLTLQSEAAGEISVEYLTKGLAWAPSYLVDLTDPESLAISQKSVIRNELTNLRDVEFRLISGFPSVRFSAVESPLSPASTWKSFFEQLIQSSRQTRNESGITSNAIYQQVRMLSQPAGGGAALGPADEGEGVDLHYQSIGRHSLAPGESLSLQVAEARSEYERVVEWKIPDTRAPNGGYLREHERRNHTDQFDGEPWDAIIFQNPFDFPMTTAPAMLRKDGKFQGQQVSNWTNPGEETCIRITKALSISARSIENEIPDSRENLRIAGNAYYKVRVQGALKPRNHRSKPATMIINLHFSGEFIDADADPA